MKRLCFLQLVILFLTGTAANSKPGGGSVSGRVTFEGVPAKPKPIDMAKEPVCAKQHAVPITTENVLAGPNNGLENVVVYVSEGLADDPAPSQS